MAKIKHLAWLLGFLVPAGLAMAAAAHGHLERFAGASRGSPYHLLLWLLVAIPAGFATLAAVYLLELLLVGWKCSSLKTLLAARASVKLDLLSIAMTLLPPGRLGYILSLGLLYVIDTHSQQLRSLSLTHYLPTWGLQAACAVLFGSLAGYWMHRLEHTIPALWALHKFHHSADSMSILTAERRTHLAKGMEEFILLLAAVVVSAPTVARPAAGSALFPLALVFLGYLTFRSFNMYLVHSNLNTGYGWIGRWLLVSPRMHRLHHARSPRYHNKNFTFDLVIWDRLFGTYASCDAAAATAVPLGLDDNPFNSRSTVAGPLRDYFLTPYIVFWQELRKGIDAWRPVSLGRL